MLLNDVGKAGQFQHFFITNRELVTLGFSHIDRVRRFTSNLIGRKNHLDQLRPQIAANDSRTAFTQHGLMYVKLVGVHRALHHGFAQAIGGCHEDGIPEA